MTPHGLISIRLEALPTHDTVATGQLSKYATDDRGQKDQHSGQEQSGDNLFSQRNAV